MSHLAKRGMAPLAIETMFDTCTGMSMKPYPVKHKHCSHCKLKTAWYCVGCKRWLCMERRAIYEKQKQFNLYIHSFQSVQTKFQKQCFHKVHEYACRAPESESMQIHINSSSNDI
jgi:hypothetical protein